MVSDIYHFVTHFCYIFRDIFPPTPPSPTHILYIIVIYWILDFDFQFWISIFDFDFWFWSGFSILRYQICLHILRFPSDFQIFETCVVLFSMNFNIFYEVCAKESAFKHTAFIFSMDPQSDFLLLRYSNFIVQKRD